MAYQALEEYEAALFQYRRLLQTAPDGYRARYNMALFQAEIGQQQLAIASYTQALDAVPEDTVIQAKIYRGRGGFPFADSAIFNGCSRFN